MLEFLRWFDDDAFIRDALACVSLLSYELLTWKNNIFIGLELIRLISGINCTEFCNLKMALRIFKIKIQLKITPKRASLCQNNIRQY
jgi:hypothetical protein